MLILGIETSCDETAVAVVENGHDVRANVISSQIQKHAVYGGVIPELAAREHLQAIKPVTDCAIREADITISDINAVAVTYSPGLIPALLVGLSYAKGLALGLGVPLLGIDHFLAHIFGAFIPHSAPLADDAAYPMIALVVSGGHTALVRIDKNRTCRVVGRTLDDAAGEAFDKAAKILDLGYPGGPIIDRLAKRGDPTRFQFPKGLTAKPGTVDNREHLLNFSFSGVKTAMLYHLKELKLLNPVEAGLTTRSEDTTRLILDSVAGYQEAIVSVLVDKSIAAAHEFNAKTLVVCGGVACNTRLREQFTSSCHDQDLHLIVARPEYCTDNGAMIAGLGYYYLKNGLTSALNLDARPRFDETDSAPFVSVR